MATQKTAKTARTVFIGWNKSPGGGATMDLISFGCASMDGGHNTSGPLEGSFSIRDGDDREFIFGRTFTASIEIVDFFPCGFYCLDFLSSCGFISFYLIYAFAFLSGASNKAQIPRSKSIIAGIFGPAQLGALFLYIKPVNNTLWKDGFFEAVSRSRPRIICANYSFLFNPTLYLFEHLLINKYLSVNPQV